MSAERHAVYIADLSRCKPSTALSDTPKNGHWQAVPYQAEGVSGTMLVAGVECNAPTLTLPLKMQGWYAIHLGTWANWVERTVKVRLSDDPCFTHITTVFPDTIATNYFAKISESFWKYADLTDQDLLIGQMSTGIPMSAGLAYVKLEPLTSAEAEAVQSDQARTDTRGLVAYNDGWSFIASRAPTTAEEIVEEVEPYRDTDFQKLLWGINVDGGTSYLSDVGDFADMAGNEDFQRVADRQAAESLRALKRKGIDPLETVINHAHGMGLELHGAYRVGGWIWPPPDCAEDRFYSQHPEWRCVDRDGRSITRLSYAFPGVQDFVISLFREVVERGADGVNLIFVRGLPCVLYEQPVVDGFQQQYGQDPRELPEDDSRWLTYKASWMTGFMQAVRQEMNRVGQQQGRHIQVSAYVPNDVPYCLAYSLDVATWAIEGLVDFILPYPQEYRSYPWPAWTGDDEVKFNVASFVEVTRGTGCQVYPDILPRRMSPAEYQQRALDCYAMGVDGLSFWDTNGRHPHLEEWSMIRRLGHEGELAEWVPDQWPAHQLVPLHSLGGHVMDKYSPYWSA